jgi:hypothetical protein
MHVTDEGQTAFDNATYCHICDQILIKREMCGGDMDYARPMHSEHILQGREPELITRLAKSVGGILRSFVKDTRSGVVCKEIKKNRGVKKYIVAKDMMLESYKKIFFSGNHSIER